MKTKKMLRFHLPSSRNTLPASWNNLPDLPVQFLAIAVVKDRTEQDRADESDGRMCLGDVFGVTVRETCVAFYRTITITSLSVCLPCMSIYPPPPKASDLLVGLVHNLLKLLELHIALLGRGQQQQQQQAGGGGGYSSPSPLLSPYLGGALLWCLTRWASAYLLPDLRLYEVGLEFGGGTKAVEGESNCVSV